ncbi:MAG: hypothetical protein V4493_05575 [Pseudomonadota bacterium]
MKIKSASQEYLDKVQMLTAEEEERLLSRMSGKLPRRLEKDKLSKEDALAFQLELEDDQLNEWRERMAKIRDKS